MGRRAKALRREELPSCNGKFKGKWVSRTELTEIFKEHEAWLKDSSTGVLDDLPEVALGSNDPRRANLCDASVFGGYLRGADLTDVKLGGADLYDADLADAYLDFDPDSLPKLSSHLEYAKNLQYVRFRLESAALVRLRSEFKDLRLRSQETQINYAIRRSEMSRRGINGQHVHGWAERYFNKVFLTGHASTACCPDGHCRL